MKILIIEDELAIAEVEKAYIEREGYEAEIAQDGLDGLAKFRADSFDLVLLDLMLPGMAGTDVCREIRRSSNAPILMVTAKSGEDDIVAGLDAGADDYIVKPFDVKEVIARIKAVLRRTSLSNPDADSKEVHYDGLDINMTRHELTVKGKVVDAPPKELELLYHLASHPNTVFNRDQLLDEVWGFEYYGGSRTIDVHIKRLREKLENTSDQWSLKTVWGVGYKFEVKE